MDDNYSIRNWTTARIILKLHGDRGGCNPPRLKAGCMTASEIYLIHNIIRKPNSIIVLLFIQNISTFLTSLTPCRLVAYFSARFQEVNRCFFLAVTFQKVDNIHRTICLRIFAFILCSFSKKIQPWAPFFLVRSWINIHSTAPGNEVGRWTIANVDSFVIKYTIDQPRFTVDLR